MVVNKMFEGVMNGLELHWHLDGVLAEIFYLLILSVEVVQTFYLLAN